MFLHYVGTEFMIVFSYFNVFIFFTFSTLGAMPGVVKKCIKPFHT